ncbi:hypothetical protein [Ekhidna sp.]|uniref:hypothetical protein n=1 Tax=Ekhidna sp. TaxID=2608089 RepID=UPI003BAB2D78
MKLFPTLIWTFTILAFVFLFFSLRTTTNELLYSIIALVLWGAAFLLNKYKPSEKEKEK